MSNANNVNPEVVAAISAAVNEMLGGFGALRIYPTKSWTKRGIYNINVEGTDFELDVDELTENAGFKAVGFTQTSPAWTMVGRQELMNNAF
jgi:hypothetical protein